MREARAGVLLVAGDVVDHAGMQFLEDGVPIRTGEPVDRCHRALGIASAVHRPSGEQRRRQIGDRAADRLRQVPARHRVLFVLERRHPEHQLGNTIVLVGLCDALGIFHGFVDVAVDQQRQKSAVEQFTVLRIVPKRAAVISGGGAGVPLLSGMTGGEIAARGGQAGEILRGRRLRGKLDRRRDQ